MRGPIAIALLVAALALTGCQDGARPGAAPGAGAVQRVDLNRATVRELERLPGIGPARARSIVASRNARGGRFARLEDLLAIDGIGARTLDALRPYVVLAP